MFTLLGCILIKLVVNRNMICNSIVVVPLYAGMLALCLMGTQSHVLQNIENSLSFDTIHLDKMLRVENLPDWSAFLWWNYPEQFASYGDEECLMQHLAAAAIGRTHHFSRRGPILFQPSAQASGHLQHVLVSSSSGSGGSTPVSSPPVASSPPSHEAPPPSFSFNTIPAVGADHSALGSSSPRSACIPLDVWIVRKWGCIGELQVWCSLWLRAALILLCKYDAWVC